LFDLGEKILVTAAEGLHSSALHDVAEKAIGDWKQQNPHRKLPRLLQDGESDTPRQAVHAAWTKPMLGGRQTATGFRNW
jgi:hypothetical protein